MPTKPSRYLAIAILLFLLAACQDKPAPTAVPATVAAPAASPTASAPAEAAPVTGAGRILISEVLTGAPGNNNHEFIELTNTGTEPIDLNGWSLWFQLNANQDEKLIYTWQSPADVPGLGHYLLTRAGQELGILGDAEYEVAIFESLGGLALRDAQGQTVDAVGWGGAPPGFFGGSPALAPDAGASLERLPGGSAGNLNDTGDNAADLVGNPTPSPQNTGSSLTPQPAGQLELGLSLPDSVEPGAILELQVELTNRTGAEAQNLLVSLPLPAEFAVDTLPAGFDQADGRLEWQLPALADGETAAATVKLQSPWTYLSERLQGAYAAAENWPLRAYAGPLPVVVAGGSIPIATARTLVGKTVTIEGTATMYTDAFYAGSTGTKFYIEDETGGIQVYCPGGMGLVQVQLGQQVRVSGKIEVYRSSLEIIPGVYPDDVQILDEAGQAWEPMPVTVPQAGSDEEIVGRLVVAEGTVSRIQEFSFSYELDLTDDQGYSVLVYIEKETSIDVEPLEIGRKYRLTGVSEKYDGDWQLKPRLQADLVEVHPPELALSLTGPNSIQPGGTIEYALTATNHTTETLTNLQIVAPRPAAGGQVLEVLDGGQQDGALVVWTLPELAGDGNSATVRYRFSAEAEQGAQILAPAARATADQWPNTVNTGSLLTFVGQGVPIWAIQGEGFESPYVRSQASTAGLVIGVFPELEGFWIQEPETDSNPQTSAGLFVLVDPAVEIQVELGDRVQVSGRVREKSGQTLLNLTSAGDLLVLSSGNPLPEAVELDPPRDDSAALAYYEAIEGMLVQVTAPAVVVDPTSQYGETVLVAGHWGIDRVMQGEPTGLLIMIDDGSSVTHLDSTTLPFVLKSGDVVSNAVGPLAYTYDHFKIEPLAAPEFSAADRPLPFLTPAGANSLSIATFNAENFFDFQAPNPSDPPMPSLAQYRLKVGKTAEAIMAMGAPTVVALQEIENIGILEDLAAADAIAQFQYQPFLIEGDDSRGIDVGYLVRADQARVEGVAALPAPEGLTSRPPLLITVTLQTLSGQSPTVYLLNNHFLSMSGGEEITEPRRTAQAEWNLTLVEQILAREPEAYVVVLGDLNSFYQSLPIETLQAGSLRHVYEFVAPELPYTYIFEGESETLDHILVTPALYEHLSRVQALHIDADYPLPAPDDATPRHVSDHDPLIAVFTFE